MAVIADKNALAARRDSARAKIADRHGKTVVNVSCGTCGISAGAERVLDIMRRTAAAENIASIEFFRSGCMTYCYAEPTVTITRPGREPVTFGFVDEKKAKALVSRFIAKGADVEGVIPAGYERVVL